MEARHITNCRLCFGSRLETILTAESGFWLKEASPPRRKRFQTDLGVCSTCGHGQVINDLSPGQVSEMYLPANVNLRPDNEFLTRFSSNALPGQYNIIEKYLHSETTLADIGCNRGQLLAAVQVKENLNNENLLGIDFLDQRIWDFPLRIEDLNDTKLSSNLSDLAGAFDIVTITSVLEHILDPRKLLTVLHDILKPDGILFVEVPNALDQLSKQRLLTTSIVHPHHLHYFTPTTLHSTLSDCGFEILEFRNWDCENWLAQQIVCRKQKTRGASSARDYLIQAKDLFSTYEAELHTLIKKKLKGNQGVGLWGCGTEFIRLIERFPDLLEDLNAGSILLIDSDLAGEKVMGKTCLSAEEFLIEFPSFPIVLTVHYQAARNSMFQFAQSRGFSENLFYI